MSSVVDDRYSTLDEFLESQRSPTLSRAELNFDSLDTPPPLVDAPDDFDTTRSEGSPPSGQSPFRRPGERQVKPSLTDCLLIRQLGPGYDPAIATQAGLELCCDEPEGVSEDRIPQSAYDHFPMISSNSHRDVYNTSDHQLLVQQALTASRRASEKLNDAMRFQHPNLTIQANGADYRGNNNAVNHYLSQNHRDKKRISISITSLTSDESPNPREVAQLSIQGSPAVKQVDVPSLSFRNVKYDAPNPTVQRAGSVTQSPALSRYAIPPQDFNSAQTLAKIHSQSSPQSSQASPVEFKQTLPSLETALSSVSDIPSAISRRSPSHLSPYGRSPSTFSQPPVTTASLSPPRFSTYPTLWHSTSQNSSSSTMSEYVSAPGSNSASTPASSAPRHSPSHSVTSPQYHGSEHSSPESETTALGSSDGVFDGSNQRMNGTQGYTCSWPDCNAPPFQTQYLLNSHTNVHSNTRPHFCPVKDCPRGPGGQGFKRKNEMIRHGLVHQSPGYICPFCADQQHKYPRPDNLQRHVRVHHVDKGRDDPMLRDVLAQRPEGGNRGRRRRLGS